MGKKISNPNTTEEEMPLSKATEILIDECRMILPGIQTLFGFQLIAVFNSTFTEKLSPLEQRLHLLAIGLIGLAIVIIMTPAAYHRQTGPQHASQHFIVLATRLLLFSMPLLALSLCMEIYLVSRLILENSILSLIITAVIFMFFVILWFALPRTRVLQYFFSGKQ